MSQALVKPVEDHATPDVIMTLASRGEEVRVAAAFMVHPPSIERHASKSSLYAIAIQQLHANGVLDQIVDSLLANGPLSEVDAANRINLHHE